MTATDTTAAASGVTPRSLSAGHELLTSVRIALRELRSGLQGFRIFLLCLILGVTALAAVRSVSSGIESGLIDEGQMILGGDVAFHLVHREATPEERSFLEGQGQLSTNATLRAMARNVASGARGLVEVKAVDDRYPLYGEVGLRGDGNLSEILERRDGVWGLAADPIMLARLQADIGDRLRIGELDFELRDIIVREPDRASEGIMFGPRAMMAQEALQEAELIQPGSLITWKYNLRLANTGMAWLQEVIEAAQDGFPDAGWRIRSRLNAAPGVETFVERMTLFLSLVGLTALFVGGVGIANAVGNFLDARRRNIAIMKCLGAPGRVVFKIYLVQVLLLACLGVAAGVVLGAMVPVMVSVLFGDALPVPLRIGIYPEPLAMAGLFGILVTLAFSVWPLARARDLPALALFREAVAPRRTVPRPIYLSMTGASLALLVALALMAFEDRAITSWYIVGLAIGFAVLILIGQGVKVLARVLPGRRSALVRLSLANLHRPGSPTISVILSLGLGLSLFVALAQVDANLSRELRTNLPGQAPSFFFLDINPGERERFIETVSAQPGAHDIQSVPMLRGRITQVAGTPVGEIEADPDVAWVLRGDRGLTYSDAAPEGVELVQGRWWPSNYDGEPLVSMDAEAARGLGLALGDTITVNVLGRDVTARLANTRNVDWRTLSINFVMVFSENALRAAPHTMLVTVKAPPDREEGLFRAVTDAFPNVTVVRVKEAIDAVNQLMADLLLAVRGANSVTLLVGVLVLAGALATGLRARIYDAVVLKTLGARRSQLLSAYALEYGLLGVITACFAILAGSVASYAIVTGPMAFEWRFAPGIALATATLATLVTIVAGLATTWSALRVKAAFYLRNE